MASAARKQAEQALRAEILKAQAASESSQPYRWLPLLVAARALLAEHGGAGAEDGSCPDCGGSGWIPAGDEQLGCIRCNGTGLVSRPAPPPASDEQPEASRDESAALVRRAVVAESEAARQRQRADLAERELAVQRCALNDARAERDALLAEQPEARNAMPDAVRAARDKAQAAIDREGGPMTPWGLDMCAVLDALDDWERSASAPPPAPPSAAVREAAERLWHSLTPPSSTTDDGMLLVRAEDVEAVLRALSSPLAAPSKDEVREAAGRYRVASAAARDCRRAHDTYRYETICDETDERDHAAVVLADALLAALSRDAKRPQCAEGE